MLSVAERNVLERCVHELVLRALTRRVAHPREPERIEHLRVRVHRLVVVRGPRRRGQQRPGGNERPIAERDVLQR